MWAHRKWVRDPAACWRAERSASTNELPNSRGVLLREPVAAVQAAFIPSGVSNSLKNLAQNDIGTKKQSTPDWPSLRPRRLCRARHLSPDRKSSNRRLGSKTLPGDRDRAKIPVNAIIVAVAVNLIGRQMMGVCWTATGIFHPFGDPDAVRPLLVTHPGKAANAPRIANGKAPHAGLRALSRVAA